MGDYIYEVQLTLVNGETRFLGSAGGPVERAVESMNQFIENRGDFAGDWVDTVEATSVARAHVVEVQTVPLGRTGDAESEPVDPRRAMLDKADEQPPGRRYDHS